MSTEILEKYDGKPAKVSMKEYIPRKRYDTLLHGCIPYASEELYFDRLTKNNGILLTGRHGVGKRTIEKVFAYSHFDYDMTDDQPFDHYIKFPTEKLSVSGEKILGEELQKLFDDLISYSEGLDEEDIEICHVSLGNIDPIVNSEKLSKLLASRMKELIKNGTGVCIVTAVYDGELGDIPWYIKKYLLVCRVETPDSSERTAFFDRQEELMKSYVSNTAGVEYMAECTEGCTFDDLNDIMRMVQMYLKAKYAEEEQCGYDVTDIGISRVELNAEDFKAIADNFKVQSESAVDMSAVAEALSNISLNVQTSDNKAEEEKKSSPFDIFGDDDPDFLV